MELVGAAPTGDLDLVRLLDVLTPGPTFHAEDYGVVADGVTDDTAAYQTALAASAGGTLVAAIGTSQIDADWAGTGTLRLPDNVTFHLPAGAKLRAIPNSLDYHAVVMFDGCTNAHITGHGTIEGENGLHLTGTGEWGYCIEMVESYNCSVSDVRLQDAHGDGLFMGFGANNNFVIRNVVSDRNHRQGFSICRASNGVIIDCTGSNTAGTSPESGIDFEPEATMGNVENVELINFRAIGNAQAGIILTGQLNIVKNVRVIGGVSRDNGTYGLLLDDLTDCAVYGTDSHNNGNDGVIFFGPCTGVYEFGQVTGNTAFGVTLAAAAAGVRVTGGTISENTLDGVLVDITPDVVLSDLTMIDNGRHNINMMGATANPTMDGCTSVISSGATTVNHLMAPSTTGLQRTRNTFVGTGVIGEPSGTKIIYDIVNGATVDDGVESATIANIVSLTQAEYDALTPVATTLYVITD